MLLVSQGHGNIDLQNCKIIAINRGVGEGGFNNYAYGIFVGTDCKVNASECEIIGLSNYNYGDSSYYSSLSNGVSVAVNSISCTLKNCNVMGTHSGISNHGRLYIDGGIYEGYGHGGIYFAGDGTGTDEAYVANATIRECAMPEGYTATAGRNGASFYIGGASGNDNIKVYMDNCKLSAASHAFVLRGSSGEKNNSLYISNTTVKGTTKYRIDNDTHRLYIGRGCNFDITGATASTAFDYTTAVFSTDEVYTRQ